MFRNRLYSVEGSAVVGFALAFPLIALLFLSVTGLVTSILKRETAVTLSQQLLREEIRLPLSDDVPSQIQRELSARGYDVKVTSMISHRNTSRVIVVDLTSQIPTFRSRIYGVYEQAYE